MALAKEKLLRTHHDAIGLVLVKADMAKRKQEFNNTKREKRRKKSAVMHCNSISWYVKMNSLRQQYTWSAHRKILQEN